VKRVDVRGAVAMQAALWQALGTDLSRADALVMAAAVADHRPAETSPSKMKKGDDRITLELVKNPDLLAEVGAVRSGRRPVLVGFAVETADGPGLVSYAKRKLTQKKVDLVVANPAGESFGRDDNQATLVSASGAEALGAMSKLSLADVVLDRVRDLLHAK
jgi:phosphopantothenoylcysteine decarboxylase/phosphopantothenate--cysteine ligase